MLQSWLVAPLRRLQRRSAVRSGGADVSPQARTATLLYVKLQARCSFLAFATLVTRTPRCRRPGLRSTDPSTFCVHLRLHPGITWSHTSGAPCHLPPLSPSGREVTPSQCSLTVHSSGGSEDAVDDRGLTGGSVGGASESDGPRERQGRAVLAADFGLLTFIRDEGTGEWDYPWDLTGGLYR